MRAIPELVSANNNNDTWNVTVKATPHDFCKFIKNMETSDYRIRYIVYMQIPAEQSQSQSWVLNKVYINYRSWKKCLFGPEAFPKY